MAPTDCPVWMRRMASPNSGAMGSTAIFSIFLFGAIGTLSVREAIIDENKTRQVPSIIAAGITHYGTGPAPIYFNAGYVDQKTWWKFGLIISVLNIIIWMGVGFPWWKVLGLW